MGRVKILQNEGGGVISGEAGTHSLGTFFKSNLMWWAMFQEKTWNGVSIMREHR